MFQKGICVLLGAVLALAMVTGATGCSKSSSKKENSTLRLTFRGDETNALKSGVIVILYNTDNVTPLSIKTTAADGIADFGNIGRTTATYSWGWTVSSTLRSIQTVIEGPVLNEVLFLEEPGTAETATLVTMEVQYLGAPSSSNVNASYQLGDDGWEDFREDSRVDIIWRWLNTPVVPSNQQNDGRLTILGRAYSTTTGDILKYGYLQDRNYPTSGTTFTVNLDRDPEVFSWTSTAAVAYVGIDAIYRDSEYELETKSYGSRSATSGSFNYPRQVPHDRSYPWAETPWITAASGGTVKFIRYSYSGSAPGSLQFQIPDYEFSSVVTPSGTSSLVSWTLGGTTTKDMISFEFEQTSGSIETEWSIAVSPEKTSFTVPTLPAELSWFSWGTTYSRDLEVEDSSNASGFKDFIRKIVDDENSDTNFRETGTWREGFYVFPTTAGAAPQEKPQSKKRGHGLFSR